jgi:hypothetical protein
MEKIMTLPKIDYPTYRITVPSSGKEITVRAFTVREEKLLLLAVETGKVDEQINAVKQVINNCIIEGELDVNKNPFFDVDFLYIFLHGKSMGETIDVSLTCNNVLDDGNRCGCVFPTKLDISNYEVIKDETLSPDIKLDKDKGVKMRYPSYYAIKKIEEAAPEDKKTVIIINSIEHIWDKKTVHSSKDYSSQELKDFVEGLTEENYKKLENFVDNFPGFLVKLEAECPKCGFQHNVRYSDFQDFFD